MSFVEEEYDSELLLQAQSHIWNHIFNFINSMSLKCAIDLCIPDIVHNHGKSMPLSCLTDALPINPSKASGISRLMRLLIHSGFFKKVTGHDHDEEESYLLTPTGRLLIKDHPLSPTPYLLAMLDPVVTNPWNFLSTWFQNDSATPFEIANGRTLWDYAEHEPKLNKFINDAMASDARLVSSVVISKSKHVFDGLTCLVDVGGGSGTMSMMISKEFPHLECICFDLPHVVDGLKDADNLKFLGGDMFQAIPPADALLLKWILHDWNDEECVKILEKCKEAIEGKEGGKLIIIDMIMENQKGDEESTETQLFFDMLMMALVTGKERTENQWEKLFLEAGFRHYKITPALGLRSIIEVFP